MDEGRVTAVGGPRIIVLLGPPGGGKGTQAKKLAAAFGMKHTSTGELLREEIRRETELGRRVKATIEAGDLVSDRCVGEIVEQQVRRLGENGIILDGYPRNVAQAEFLASITEDIPVEAINIEVEESQIVRRLAGRRFCSRCGNIYNIYFSPPQATGICDNCGTELLRRPDDKEEVIEERLKVYREETRPVIDYYRDFGNYHEVDGNWDADEVYRDICLVVGAFAA
ncbi:MAG: adenylate kinase [Acidobacteriota bacterium]|nr:MAG: adenylate kinase [Acidobacteriota bacterium]